MSEEIEHRILEIEVSLHLLSRVTKHIIDKELPDARKEFFAAKFEQDRLFKIPERELTELDKGLLRKLRKDVPELRSYYRKLREDLDGYIERSDRLEDELEWLRAEKELLVPPPVIIPPLPPVIPPEFIDINEEDGYLIYYSRIKKMYFKVHPDEYKRTEGKIVE